MSTFQLSQSNINEALARPIVLIDFYGPKCHSCKSFAPIYEKASNSNPDVLFAKLDTSAEPDLANGFNVKSLPTLIAIKNGQIAAIRTGILMAGQLDQIIRSLR